MEQYLEYFTLKLTVVLNASPSRRLPYVFELPIKGAQLTVLKPASSAVKLDLGFIKAGLKDLRNVAPRRKVCDTIGLVWYLS